MKNVLCVIVIVLIITLLGSCLPVCELIDQVQDGAFGPGKDFGKVAEYIIIIGYPV